VIRYRSLAHAPTSISLQRSEQNGRHFDAGVHGTEVPHCGHLTMRGGEFIEMLATSKRQYPGIAARR
jgi:hypothetical protein